MKFIPEKELRSVEDIFFDNLKTKLMNYYFDFDNSLKHYIPKRKIEASPLSYHYYKSAHQIETFMNYKEYEKVKPTLKEKHKKFSESLAIRDIYQELLKIIPALQS